jgi:hypothetical protein
VEKIIGHILKGQGLIASYEQTGIFSAAYRLRIPGDGRNSSAVGLRLRRAGGVICGSVEDEEQSEEKQGAGDHDVS